MRITVYGRRFCAILGRSTHAICVTVAVAAALLSLLLRALIPVTALRADYDNSLYVRLADSLVGGRWLGRFDDLTLAKAPGYPMFVAAMKLLGLPLKLGEQLTAVLAAAALAGCIWVLTRRPVLTTAVFVVFVLDAGQFAAISAQIRRDGWYSSLTVLLLCGQFLLVRAALSAGGPRWRLAAWSAGLGVVLAAYWLCREESCWIIPVLLIGLLAPVLAEAWRRGRRPRPARPAGQAAPVRATWPAIAVRLAVVCCTAGALVVLPMHYIAARNLDRYGTALVNDGSGRMGALLALWGGVQAGPPLRYVTVTTAQRQAVYQVSPAALELAPSLEDPRNVWLARGFSSCPAYHPCTEYASWLEGFAIRDAITAAGHFRDEATAQTYLDVLIGQIQRACGDGRLRCESGLGFLPGVHDLQVGDSLRDAFGSLRFAATNPYMLLPVGSSVNRGLGWTPQAQRDAAAVVVGMPGSVSGADRAQHRYQSVRGLFAFWASCYGRLMPALIVLALLGAALGLARRGGGGGGLGQLTALLAGALACRAALIGLVNATTLHGAITSPGYEQVSRVLLVALGLVGAAQLVDGLPRSTGAGPGGPWRLRFRRAARTQPLPAPAPPARTGVPVAVGGTEVRGPALSTGGARASGS